MEPALKLKWASARGAKRLATNPEVRLVLAGPPLRSRRGVQLLREVVQFPCYSQDVINAISINSDYSQRLAYSELCFQHLALLVCAAVSRCLMECHGSRGSDTA